MVEDQRQIDWKPQNFENQVYKPIKIASDYY